MKKFMLVLSTVLFTTVLFAQTATQKKAEDYVKFKEMTHDFGKIKQGVPVTFDFAFINVADKPIVIESATASCGCTTPVKPEGAIAKGKVDKITAGFNAQTLGIFNKSIYVKVAGVDTPVEIKITGEVLSEMDFVKYEKVKSGKKGK